jgi:hypothetical protein
MKDLYSLDKTASVLIFIVLFFAATMENTVFAQRAIPAAVERRVEQMNRQIEQGERDNLYRDFKGEKNKTERISAQAKLAQIKKDFDEIQAGYNLLVTAMSSKENLDYESIFGTVAEINKSAARLKENLALPRAKERETKSVPVSEEDTTQLKESLLLLRKHIFSFVTNPLFEAPTALNLEQAEKAGQNLDRIIELSENIKKNSEKLKMPF